MKIRYKVRLGPENVYPLHETEGECADDARLEPGEPITVTTPDGAFFHAVVDEVQIHPAGVLVLKLPQ